MRVDGESYLWGAVAPLRAANAVVRVNGKALVAVVCYIIDGKTKAVAEEDYNRPAAPVSPIVSYYLDILGYDGSIFFYAALNLDNMGWRWRVVINTSSRSSSILTGRPVLMER